MNDQRHLLTILEKLGEEVHVYKYYHSQGGREEVDTTAYRSRQELFKVFYVFAGLSVEDDRLRFLLC